MDIEERMAKVEAENAMLKAMQAETRATIERGFSEQRAAMAEQRAATTELRAAMERGFSEERLARERAVRWAIGLSITILTLVLGMIGRMTGLF